MDAATTGAPIAGAVVSTTLTLKEPAAEFSRESDAVHPTVVSPRANVEPEAGTQLTVRVPSTVSEAVAVKRPTAPPAEVASRVMSPGSTKTGAWVSLTVTLKVLLALLPRVSCAEQVTVVLPIGNVAPETGKHPTTRLPSTVSVADGFVKLTTAPLAPVASVVTLEGTFEIVGAVVSRMVTVKLPRAVFPAASVAEQLTVVVPKAKVVPEAGAQVTAGAAGFASVAVAEKVTTRPAALVASSVMLSGRFRAGAVVSQLALFRVADTFMEAVRVMVVRPSSATPVAAKVTEPELLALWPTYVTRALTVSAS